MPLRGDFLVHSQRQHDSAYDILSCAFNFLIALFQFLNPVVIKAGSAFAAEGVAFS